MYFAGFVIFSVTCMARGDNLRSTCTLDGQFFEYGQQYDAPGFCGKNVCGPNNTWIRMPCGLIALSPGYRMIPEDTNKPYPDCCAQAVPVRE